jgi:hypothetical protein
VALRFLPPAHSACLVLPPTGYFDPMGLSKGKDQATLKKW